MLLDLVSPWAAAVEATDPARACAAFRRRHAPLLDALRRQRAPLDTTLALATDRLDLDRYAAAAADAGVQQEVRDVLARAAEHGALVAPAALLASAAAGDSVEALVDPATIAVLVNCVSAEEPVTVAVARAAAAVTRWTAADSASPLRRTPGEIWDRWLLARTVPLSEWLYTEGIGVHLAAALHPGLPPRHLLGVPRGAYHRLRERERALRALLAGDLERAGVDLVLRWLLPAARSALPASAGPADDGRPAIPAMAGRYLAWRMTAERVTRVGLEQAMRMAA
jgi:hypothetical protein